MHENVFFVVSLEAWHGFLSCLCLCMGVEEQNREPFVTMSLYDGSEVMSVCMVCLLSLHGFTWLLSLHDEPKRFGLVV